LEKVSKQVTVILNGFRRPHALEAQMEAVKRQTVKPESVMFWQNGASPEHKFDYNLLNSCILSINNQNFGVWARFAYALNAETEYVCVFDDDTIPGSKWLENCLDTITEHNGLLGTNGVIFNDLEYQSYNQHGWAKPNEETEQVDIVGHSWFFKREWLGAFWKEAPLPKSRVCGEDMYFSYAIQKHLGLSTYVPPHPKDDLEMWGSNPEFAYKFGVDKHAISVNYHGTHFGDALKETVDKGFKLINI
jgi:hypothetical protein